MQSGCFACHAQTAAHLAVSAAREKGIRVDERAAVERQKQITSTLVSAGAVVMESRGGGDDALYEAEALARAGQMGSARCSILHRISGP